MAKRVATANKRRAAVTKDIAYRKKYASPSAKKKLTATAKRRRSAITKKIG